jgi:excisionase family DNA binding protein
MDSSLLKVPEVAERLSVSPSTIYNLVESGKLACYRIGKGRGAIRFSEAQVLQYLEGAKAEPEQPASTPLRDIKYRGVSP